MSVIINLHQSYGYLLKEKTPRESSRGAHVIMKVPKVGIEPTFPREHDFESCASANSATPAMQVRVYLTIYQGSRDFS